ncbi:hypothetical protein [Phyllobacterium brassicacearum]|uniref:hypothetical protein n=1 Tax=Phyllobacterium brassicacearum TaxID=314235 RepID=UPI0010E8D921|nr:hypothetical protein [Phyllobacterium brassicacearum]TDQ33918.1 hypothetical protein DEV91_104121 [Phyllobacterium brassicacearum]
MTTISALNAAPQTSNPAQTPSASQEQFEAALNQAVIGGGSSLLAQEMMKVANEMLNEAMSEDE